MGEIIEQAAISSPPELRTSVTDVIRHVAAVQEVMRSVMKPDVHYGRIPGAGDKPVLFKPGAEVLCMMFRIADEYDVEDLSSGGAIRYRVRCIAVHQPSSVRLGSGLGEASTDEEKYRWRKAVCQEEFDAVSADLKRVKYVRKSGGFYTVPQIRTESADLANTVLKMACKRAKIAMVLNVTAASDMFSQDLEDLDTELVRHLAEDDRVAHMHGVRQEWIDKVNAAQTEDEWRAITREAKSVFQAGRDVDGFREFSAAAAARAQEIKKNA